MITSRQTDEQGWPDPCPPHTVTSWYTYDDLGNRISHKYRGAGAIGYAHDKANRMTTLATKTQGYDLAGNLTLAYSADRGTSYTYRWDHHNRLTGVYDSTNTTRNAGFTYDALGRRIEFINDSAPSTTRYYYDGVNEVVEDNQSATRQRYYIHGVSYVDERLMMYDSSGTDRPYYYVLDRMYNVRAIIDRAGAIVERYAYDDYGRPFIRESCGRGDMNQDTKMNATDDTRFAAAKAGTIWDPRADMDDDGDVDSADQTLYDAKRPDWNLSACDDPMPTVAQAFSDVGNWYMFQGVPHLALDTKSTDTDGKLMLNHHRARYEDPVAGLWINRDPVNYNIWMRPAALIGGISRHYIIASDRRLQDSSNFILKAAPAINNLYVMMGSSPVTRSDSSGLAFQCPILFLDDGSASGCQLDPPTEAQIQMTMQIAFASCCPQNSEHEVCGCCMLDCQWEFYFRSYIPGDPENHCPHPQYYVDSQWHCYTQCVP